MFGSIRVDGSFSRMTQQWGQLSFSKTEVTPGGGVLRQLFKNSEVKKFKGKSDVEVTHLAYDSRKVLPGTLFFAIRGGNMDGNQFISEAFNKGAVAVVTDTWQPKLAQGTVIVVEDVRRFMGEVAKRFYGSPDEEMDLVGVTGTNGKTTVTTLLKSLLEDKYPKVGLLGTVQYDVGGRVLPATKTTPESTDGYGLLRQMRSIGCNAATMEVSSHGLSFRRVQGMRLKVGVFLNLTQDHLDFHGSMEAYYQVKKQLFAGEVASEPEVMLVNDDDEYGRRLYEELTEAGKQVLRIGTGGDCEYAVSELELSERGSKFRVKFPGEPGGLVFRTQQLGRYNVVNIVAALAAAHQMGVAPMRLGQQLMNFKGVAGRMELVSEGMSFNVLVDYAHTADALQNALAMLSEITRGKLKVVFGCGGDRDRTKRGKMMVAVQEYADKVWATADNPRHESLDQIFSDMGEGLSEQCPVEWVSNRRSAILEAVESLEAGDCLLIAGKGHETYQILGDTVIPFDDRQVARELLAYRKNRMLTESVS